MSQSPNPAAPQQVAPLLALAAELLSAGRPADAIAPLRDAALLQPFDPIIQHDLGLAYLEVGRVPDAIAALQWAVASNPRYTDAYFRLGIALEKLGNIGGAIVAYDRATKLRPSLAEAWFRAGALVYELGHRDEAIGCFRRAAATGGKTSFGRLGKARALLAEDRNQEAEQVLRQTLALDPGNAMAHDLMGNLLSEFGRFDEARECFQRAIAIAPLLAGCYYDLVRCRPVTSEDDGLLQRMEAALATPGAEGAQRLRIHLAIGKAADDLGDYALAMQHFDAARRRAPGLCVVRLGRVLHRDRPPHCPLYTRTDRAGARTRQLRCDAGADPRHAAVRNNSRRADRVHASRGRGRRRVEFLERARGGVAQLRRGREREAVPRQGGGRLSWRAARDRADGGASDRQDAIQLPLGRAGPHIVPARNHHPLPARCSRHGAVDPSNSFPSGPGVSDRRRRTGRVFPELPAAHRPLAGSASCGSVHRGRLRGADPRARTSHPPDYRSLRPGVARRLPAPRMQSAGCEDPQQVADPAADLSHLGRALATLRTLAGAPARARRRRVGTGRGYRPFVIELKQPTSPERHQGNVHETDSA